MPWKEFLVSEARVQFVLARQSKDKSLASLCRGFGISAIDLDRGEITVKIGRRTLDEKCKGAFPDRGSLLKNEYIAPGEIPGALSDIGKDQLSNCLAASIKSFLERSAPCDLVQDARELPLDAALRITKSMLGECLVIQGPPGTGKTYTASCVIESLLAAGKKVGVASNSHKVVINLLMATLVFRPCSTRSKTLPPANRICQCFTR